MLQEPEEGTKICCNKRQPLDKNIHLHQFGVVGFGGGFICLFVCRSCFLGFFWDFCCCFVVLVSAGLFCCSVGFFLCGVVLGAFMFVCVLFFAFLKSNYL